jgi:hypothetical protein
MEEETAEDVPSKGTWRACCFSINKHMAEFCVRSIFGFMLTIFCTGAIIYCMVTEISKNEYVTMFFSLLSFAAGFFLGATPTLRKSRKKPRPDQV